MDARIQYVINYFRKMYHIPEDFEIGYGTSNQPINVHQADPEYFTTIQVLDISQVYWKKWKDQKLPLLFGPYNDQPFFEKINGKVMVHDDLFLSAFYFLSAWQEYIYFHYHPVAHYPYTESTQAKLNITRIPVVNFYFEILKAAVDMATGKPSQNPVWKGKSYALCLTHDVDKCQTGWLEDGFYTLKQGEIKETVKIVVQKIRGVDTWFNFQEILNIEKRVNANSTFFFLTQKKQSGGESADYRISQDKIKTVLGEIKQNGGEIGIHGSINSYKDGKHLQQEKDRIPSPVIGNRFHYLSFRNPQTLTTLEEASIHYDSTLGFAQETGFRNGIAWPFPLYDCKRDRVSPVLEIPLVIMDTTLRKYRHENPYEVFPKVKDILEQIKKINGLCAILWHNNYFTNHKFRGWGKLYEKILQHVYEEAWLASGEEVYRYCQFLLS